MAEIMRVSIMGALPGGEVWSVNPVYSIGADFGVPVSAVQAQTIATAIAALTVSTGITQMMSTSTTVTGCRVEARSIAGVLETQAEAVKGTPVPGTGASPHPYQTSIVASLRTATPGASGRGRLYFPATGVTVQSANLRVGTGFPNSFGLGVKTYLSAINGAIAATLTGVSLVVWSRATNQLHTVTGINVGDVLDTQRRRRDTLIENITAQTYP